MKICSLYGAGFYYIPGTDTCIKVGGWVRAEMNFNSNGSFLPFTGATTLDSRALNFETTRTRGIMTMDSRSQTEYGTLRSYIAGGFQSTNGTAGEIYAPRAFVQFAGFTAGRAQSFFDFYSTPAYSNTTNILSSDTGGGGDDVFAYTAQFGNGFSATIAAEDTTTRRTTVSGGGGYAGRQWPDFAANLRLDQAWGSAQVMGAVHQVRTLTDTVATPGHNEAGYALGAGVTFNLPMISKGDTVSTQFTYAKGALKYVGGGLTTFAITSGTTTANGIAADAVVSGTTMDMTEGWSVVAGYGHHWNTHLQTSLYGTYGSINYSDAAGVTLWGAGQNADWKFWQVGSRTIWTPVKNLDLSVDVMYNNIDQNLTGAAFADKGWWQGMFRVQRNFYP